MKTSDFSFELPESFIARHPPERRGESRLMVLDRRNESIRHSRIDRLADFLEPGTVLAFNDSRVRKARIYAAFDDGKETELVFLAPLDSGLRSWRVLARGLRRFRPGRRLVLPGALAAEVTAEMSGEGPAHGKGIESETALLRCSEPLDEAYFDRYGHVPLPPYMKRGDEAEDAERYQTVYARLTGSAAAPTAGLHFTENLLAELERRGMETVFLTLHVGLGTFLPIRSENLENHVMHEEECSLSEETAERLNAAKREGRKILAVGTTSVRVLESASQDGVFVPGPGRTRLFIKPGYRFSAVENLLTNFHTPESSLLVLVAAFAGLRFILDAYETAKREGYRFFSYGDAMLIL